MCELLGLCFAEPVSAEFSIREFATRDQQNADGWGLAWYPDRSAALAKEPLSWRGSNYTSFLETYRAVRSAIYMGHVRHKTRGTATHADTHPFVRELGGRDHCFAHNGTLRDLADAFPLARYHPVGATDSEYVFCYLLDEMARQEIRLSSPKSWRWLWARLGQLNAHGELNCLLTDGTVLCCYFDTSGHKSLHWRPMEVHDHEVGHLEDHELKVELEGPSANHGIVVATEPLSGTGWTRFQPGELMVLERGDVRFTSRDL